MAGYNGYSKSNNAEAAEVEGRFPLTAAIGIVAKKAHVTRDAARDALIEHGPSEWHHTSKRYNRTDYYDVDLAVVRAAKTELLAEIQSNGFASAYAKIEAAHSRGETDLAGRWAQLSPLFRQYSVTMGLSEDALIDLTTYLGY